MCLEFSTVICSVKTQITAKIPIKLHNVTFGQLHEITGTSHPVKLFFYLLKLLVHFLALFRIFSTCR